MNKKQNAAYIRRLQEDRRQDRSPYTIEPHISDMTPCTDPQHEPDWRFDNELENHVTGFTEKTYFCRHCDKWWVIREPHEQPEKEQAMAMHDSAKILIVDDSLRIIMCSFDPKSERERERDARPFRSADPNIVKGDLVVVPTDTRVGHTVVVVTEVDASIDLEHCGRVDPVLARLDKMAMQKQVALETMAIDQIRTLEMDNRREALRQEWRKQNGDGKLGKIRETLEGKALPAPDDYDETEAAAAPDDGPM